MVDEENLREWVEQKLDEGIEPQRLKNTLENAGYDPSVVDDIQNPFQGSDVEPEPIEGDQSSGGSFSEVDQGAAEKGNEESGEVRESNSSMLSMSNLDTGLPDFKQDLPWRTAGTAVMVLLVLAGVGYGLTRFMSDSGNNATSDVHSAASGSPDSCPNVGVRVSSVSTKDGSTYATVKVTRRKADAVVELYGSGELLESKSLRFKGERKVEFGEEGNKVVLYPRGCPEFRDSLGIS